MNPYEELGVERDATEDQVRKAYRKQSKSAHPDAGGDRAKWDRLSTSLSVLTDPTRRKTYDDTGRIVDDKPDNDRASALQVIEAQMAAIIAPFVNGTPNSTDPRHLNIPEVIKGKIRMEMAQAGAEIQRGETAIAKLRDIARRFSRRPGTTDRDFIADAIEAQIKNAAASLDQVRANIRIRELALQMIEVYDFEADQAMPQYVFSTSSSTNW